MAYHITWKALHTKRDKHHFYFWNLSKYKTERQKMGEHGILCPPILKRGADTSPVSNTKLRPWSALFAEQFEECQEDFRMPQF